MRPAVRVGLVLLGAAMAVYGAASLTGGWLGTPPWWERPLTGFEWMQAAKAAARDSPDRTYVDFIFFGPLPDDGPREGREWISGGVVAAGLALVAVGAWPRRRSHEASPGPV